MFITLDVIILIETSTHIFILRCSQGFTLKNLILLNEMKWLMDIHSSNNNNILLELAYKKKVLKVMKNQLYFTKLNRVDLQLYG